MTTAESNRRASSPNLRAHSVVFAITALIIHLVVICSAAVVSGVAYHFATYGSTGSPRLFLTVGFGAGLIFVLPFLLRGDYRIGAYSGTDFSHGHVFFVWLYSFLCLGAVGFLTKTTHIYSRGWLVLFFLLGFLALVGANAFLARAAALLIETGRIRGRGIMVVGALNEIRECVEQIEHDPRGVQLLATEIIPAESVTSDDPDCWRKIVAEATCRARSEGVDDVVIAMPWHREDVIHALVQAFADLPVSVHVGCANLFRAAPNLHVSQFADLKAITMVSAPLGPLQHLTKRAIDVLIAGLALVLLAPLFLVIGCLIKLSSAGPVFFRQRRGGYNLAEFRIWKFRTMSTLDDGDSIVQAQRNDSRLTPIGGFLRRYNLDELPQLINVLKGDMSIVGPRPHALAHDRDATLKITAYSRRLTVRPGITGWAQVNGLRGPTQTVDVMQARLAHDLYYIENWSIAFDLYILFLTVFSPRAYTNSL